MTNELGGLIMLLTISDIFDHHLYLINNISIGKVGLYVSHFCAIVFNIYGCGDAVIFVKVVQYLLRGNTNIACVHIADASQALQVVVVVEPGRCG